MKRLPVAEDGVIYVFADGRQKKKPGKTWSFGIRLVILMAGWDVSRIAVSFGLILPQGHADHNALFREMVKPFEPPAGQHSSLSEEMCLWVQREYEDGSAAKPTRSRPMLAICVWNRLDSEV
ncbi:MAG: hypothetical protein QF569_10435 [Candidatus Poribacteria bacterium]|jgi:hypothetical protein|nr:hypothetical protein [Candidatus Poribacteria bacterium]